MTAKELVESVINEELAPEEPFDASTSLDGMGDSLDKVKVVMDFEQRLDIDVPDEMIDSLHTVGDLIELVRRNGKGTISDAYAEETGVSSAVQS